MLVECDGKICALGLGAAKADTCALSSTVAILTVHMRSELNRSCLYPRILSKFPHLQQLRAAQDIMLSSGWLASHRELSGGLFEVKRRGRCAR